DSGQCIDIFPAVGIPYFRSASAHQSDRVSLVGEKMILFGQLPGLFTGKEHGFEVLSDWLIWLIWLIWLMRLIRLMQRSILNFCRFTLRAGCAPYDGATDPATRMAFAPDHSGTADRPDGADRPGRQYRISAR